MHISYLSTIILTLLSLLIPQLALAESFRSLAYPSEVHDGAMMYYDEYQGEIISFDLETSQKTIRLQLPGGKLRIESEESAIFDDMPGPMYFSPDHSRMLIFAPTSPPRSYQGAYPFAIDQADISQRWWIYTFETQEATLLSEDFSHVGWYSNQQIMYIYQDQEVAVTNIDQLDQFEVLQESFSGTASISQPIIANSERFIIPTSTGYIINNRGEVNTYQNQAFTQISTNINQDSVFIFGETFVDILDWNGTVTGQLSNLNPLSSVIPLSDNRLLLLLLDGNLIVYASDGTSVPVTINQQPIDSITPIDPNVPDTVLMSQGENVFVYNITENRIQATVVQDPESPVEISNSSGLQRVESTSISPLIIIAGSALILILIGGGLYLWKRSKAAH